MRLEETKGLKVVSTATAETVGKITDYVLDTPARRVAALKLKKTQGDGDTVPWASIGSFGPDAVIVADAAAIVAAPGEVAELEDKRFRAHKKKVLTTSGEDLGEVADIEFDPTTGAVVSLLVGKGGKDSIDGSRLVATGSYAVVVTS